MTVPLRGVVLQNCFDVTEGPSEVREQNAERADKEEEAHG